MFCGAIGREDLLQRDEYATDGLRRENYLKLAGELEEVFIQKTRDEWVALLDSGGIPCGPILNMAETFAHPQIQAREMSVELEHPAAGRMRVLGFPPKLSETRVGVRTPAPLLGEHTDEVLREFGTSEDEIKNLRDSGAVA